jgi:hypothetical protein
MSHNHKIEEFYDVAPLLPGFQEYSKARALAVKSEGMFPFETH